MIVALIKNKICLVDLKPEHYDEIQLSIMAARSCGFKATENLVKQLNLSVYVVFSLPILMLDWYNLAALITVLDEKQSEQFENSKSYRLLDEIIELLTCAVDMKLELAK